MQPEAASRWKLENRLNLEKGAGTGFRLEAVWQWNMVNGCNLNLKISALTRADWCVALFPKKGRRNNDNVSNELLYAGIHTDGAGSLEKDENAQKKKLNQSKKQKKNGHAGSFLF